LTDTTSISVGELVTVAVAPGKGLKPAQLLLQRSVCTITLHAASPVSIALLLPALKDERPLVEIAERIATALETAFLLNGLPIEIEASIGSVLYPDHGEDAETLLRRADAAM